MSSQEEAEREARRKAIREQIQSDQQTGAKRDDKALKREQEWYRDQAARKGRAN